MANNKLITYLCEKPSQAADVAKFLGLSPTDKRKNHFINEKLGIAVIHAVGHLFELEEPQVFVPELSKNWALSKLPVFPKNHQVVIKKGMEPLFNTIKGILKKSHTVVIATDADNEGELIARDIIAKTGFQGVVKRALYHATDDKSLRKAFDNLLDGKKTEKMALEADIRRRLDWIIGMNLTMAMTTVLKTNKELSKGAFPVGRVITAVGLIVYELEQRIKNFKPIKFYNVDAMCATENGEKFKARLKVPAQYCDEDGRCISAKAATSFANQLKGKTLSVASVKSEEKRETPPLPHDLSSLQIAVDKFGIDADETLQLLQGLYDKPNSVVTYPRTDCRYLPTGMLGDVKATIKHLNNLSEIKRLDFDMDRVPKSFNDKKVEIHHGIIPTLRAATLSRLTEKQLVVYLSIAIRFVMQFMNDYRYFSQQVVVQLGGVSLEAKAIQIIDRGWRSANVFEGGDKVTSGDEISVAEGDQVKVIDATVIDGITKAPSRLSTAKLVAAMEKPARYVTDEKIKALLKEGDGIGTPATRSDVIKRALMKNIIMKKGKFVAPAKLFEKHAGKFIKMNPGFTALMQKQFKRVVADEITQEAFFSSNEVFVKRMIEEWVK